MAEAEARLFHKSFVICTFVHSATSTNKLEKQ